MSAAVASPTSDGGISAEEQLQQLRAKTNAWKQSVAVQLQEAAKKNQQLREQLRAMTASHEESLAAVRVQLDKEFRERTALKDEELNTLQLQLNATRDELRAQRQPLSLPDPDGEAEGRRLRAALLAQQQLTQHLQQQQQQQQHLQQQQQRHLAALEEEARMREEAFAALLLSEDSRALVRQLQDTLQEARAEAEQWRSRAEGMERQIAESAENPKGQEEALAAEALRLEARAQLLRVTEGRLEELKRSLAAQASVVLQQQQQKGHSQSHPNAEGTGESQASQQRRDGAVGGGPRRYLQMMRDRGGVSPLRLRTLLPVLLMAASILMFLLAGRRVTMPLEEGGRQ